MWNKDLLKAFSEDLDVEEDDMMSKFTTGLKLKYVGDETVKI